MTACLAPQPPSTLPSRFRRLGKALGGAAASISLAVGVLAPAVPAFAQSQGPSFIRDTEVEEILHEDADPIFTAAGLDPRDIRILIVGDKDINAFATTGGNLGMSSGSVLALNTGTIIKADNPNELIGVIAHETGHIAGGHIARSGDGQKQALGTYILTMGLGVLAAAAGAPDAAFALIGNSGYFAALSMAGYTREQESRADQAAATYLDRAGQSGKGLVDFFDKMRYQEVFSDLKKYRFFVDHPLSGERIDALRVRVEALPHYKAVDSPEAIEKHRIMQAKLKAYMNLPQQTFIDYKETDASFAARYARAIAYYKALETDKAMKALDALIADHPDNPYLYEVKGQALFESGRAKEAEPAYRKAVQIKPSAPLLHLSLGQTLLALDDDKRVDEAVAELRRCIDLEGDNAFAWRQLAEAYDRKGEPGQARLAAAEQYFALGQMKDAKIFAARAREQLPKNTPQWRRATDIFLVANPTKDDLKGLSRDGGASFSGR
ncbi:peptidase M48 [Caulobacter sp. CCUG 60055]|nr:M48 family metalloprotease [Caulobacter sp. CCUG 60055]MCI3178744.1 peptidase M48 [Caulobacter sp. CCUG 60055]